MVFAGQLPASPFRFTSRTPADAARTATSCSKSRAARSRNACRSCATNAVTSSARIPAASPPRVAEAVRQVVDQRIPSYYRPESGKQKYVQHLRRWYAQSHPDEDFAETFAVWLRPRSDWRRRYAGWPALKKLRICRQADGGDRRKRPSCAQATKSIHCARFHVRSSTLQLDSAHSIRSNTPKTYDEDLLRLFSCRRSTASPVRGGVFLHRRNRTDIRAWSRSGPANISSRSTPCSAT